MKRKEVRLTPVPAHPVEAQQPTHAYIEGEGPLVNKLAESLKRQDLEVFTDCKILACETCGHFACVCEVRTAHKDGCRLRLAVTCAIPISCDAHGQDA